MTTNRNPATCKTNCGCPFNDLSCTFAACKSNCKCQNGGCAMPACESNCKCQVSSEYRRGFSFRIYYYYFLFLDLLVTCERPYSYIYIPISNMIRCFTVKCSIHRVETAPCPIAKVNANVPKEGARLKTRSSCKLWNRNPRLRVQWKLTPLPFGGTKTFQSAYITLLRVTIR